MFDLAGVLYDIVKDVAGYAQWDEEEKLVDFQWPEYSGFKAKLEELHKAVVWSRPDQVQRRLHEGYEIAYEIDNKRRTRRRLVLRDGLVLMCKPVGN